MTDPMDQPEPDEYGLVMPFVVCASQGGPYDDQSFVAGYQAGQIDKALAAAAAVGAASYRATVYAPLLRQVELLAMRYGFPVIEVGDAVAGEWITVTMSQGGGS